ncbi:hypothetical protein Tsubulata_034038 [Turnera subulata]|uniref:Protein kinase domain-containing protein n=1 Tax=Turnera subulata TaxID=218843 RepID=A0A9Q0FIT1_9ROSI|nr:hypothetical protein Tsubulata_034038 [Turnera subulata]
MEQFRQIGEVLGSMRALMVFRENIQINERQCILLLDLFSFAYDTIAEEMRQNLRFEEKQIKWRILEQPLKEVCRVFKEGELYIRQSLDTKDWWAKAIILYQNTDCVEFHVHNLLSCVPVVMEAIEIAGEFSGLDQEVMQKKRLVFSKKYDKEWKDPRLFQWKFAKQYLITQDFCSRFGTVWKEDRWILLNKIQEKKITGSTKSERLLADLLLKNLEESDHLAGKLLPVSILVGSKDYQVRRRLGNGSQHKEIMWLGDSFALTHFFGDIGPLIPEVSCLLSLSHTNILHYLCGFTDEEKKECFLVTDLMSKDLGSYIRETCGPRKRLPFSLPVAIDLMLQIARGMEYLHRKKIYHGNLSPANILVKVRNSSSEGYLHAKVSGFGLASVRHFSNPRTSPQQNGTLPFIWDAPEVLEEKEQTGSTENTRYSEKSDVYSFGMVFFEVLTGKTPFEDGHLQGDKMSRNIRTGERPLFPFSPPKYVTSLTRRCWHTDPNQRPSFSSICRILRYTKRFLTMNPDYNRELDPPMPIVDYGDTDSKLLQKFPFWDAAADSSSQITQIPFQMFVYRAVEKEKTRATQKETSESGSDRASIGEDESPVLTDDTFTSHFERRFHPLPDSTNKKPALSKRSDLRPSSVPATPKGRSSRPPQLSGCRRSLRLGSESQLSSMIAPRIRRTASGHASDSELT